MLALGLSSKREITRTRVRVRTAMATQTLEQGRYLGGRPPYGYRLADAGPHPNKAHAAWGRRAHKLEPDPETAPVVTWMFAQRLAGHSAARITRALNDAGVPCPSAADPGRNPHRTGAGWTLRTVAAILAQPAVHGPAGVEPAAVRGGPGRPGQHRARAPAGAAVEPARRLGHLQASRARGAGQRGRLHRRPGHSRAARARPGRRCAGTCWPGCSSCGRCGRRLESAWSNGRPAYRCRHGYCSATVPDPARPKNIYLREDRILPHLAALSILLAGGGTPDRARQAGITAPARDRGPDRPAARHGHRADLRPGHPHHPGRGRHRCRRHRRPAQLNRRPHPANTTGRRQKAVNE